MNKKLKPLTRIFTLICAAALVAVIFLPLWRIELSAPQYPEGLALTIYPNKLGGDVEVVNGLNHYIGMRTLHASDFVEFTVLPYIIAIFALFGLLSFLINRKWFYTIWTILFSMFGIIAMVDFYRWEYNYGHNLDPTAPIRVPGMAYQPPLIGYKQLLNFGAYSIPDIGGWLFLLVGILLFTGLVIEWKGQVKTLAKTRETSKAVTTALMVIIMLSTSCSAKPEPITNQDACHFCKMTITSSNYAAEWITDKGKVFKFDDIHCLQGYLKDNTATAQGSAWFMDFAHPGQFIPAEKALLLQSDELKSPMGGNTAAFSSETERDATMQKFGGQPKTWEGIK